MPIDNLPASNAYSLMIDMMGVNDEGDAEFQVSRVGADGQPVDSDDPGTLVATQQLDAKGLEQLFKDAGVPMEVNGSRVQLQGGETSELGMRAASFGPPTLGDIYGDAAPIGDIRNQLSWAVEASDALLALQAIQELIKGSIDDVKLGNKLKIQLQQTKNNIKTQELQSKQEQQKQTRKAGLVSFAVSTAAAAVSFAGGFKGQGMTANPGQTADITSKATAATQLESAATKLADNTVARVPVDQASKAVTDATDNVTKAHDALDLVKAGDEFKAAEKAVVEVKENLATYTTELEGLDQADVANKAKIDELQGNMDAATKKLETAEGTLKDLVNEPTQTLQGAQTELAKAEEALKLNEIAEANGIEGDITKEKLSKSAETMRTDIQEMTDKRMQLGQGMIQSSSAAGQAVTQLGGLYNKSFGPEKKADEEALIQMQKQIEVADLEERGKSHESNIEESRQLITQALQTLKQMEENAARTSAAIWRG